MKARSWFVAAGAAWLLLCVSCASARKPPVAELPAEDDATDEPGEELALEDGDAGLTALQAATISTDETGTTIIPVRRTPASYFSSIDKDVLALAEDGSPDSLRAAVTALHKPGNAYTESEATLLNLCGALMRIVWPSERTAWEIPPLQGTSPYMAAVDSAERGIYDSSTGNSDFFTLLLPSLLLLTNSSRTDWYAQSEEALQQALALRGDSVLARYLRGVLAVRMQQPEQALEYLDGARRSAPASRDIQIALATARFAAGEYETALASAESLLGMDNQNLALLELCCDSAAALGDYEKAEQYVLRVLQLEPENLHFLLVRTRILMAKGDYIKASSLLDVYSRTSVVDRDYLLLRAQLQRDWNKNTAAAGDTIGKALSYYADDKEVLLFAAAVANESGNKVGGLSALELAALVLEQEPGNAEALRICIAELSAQGKWQEAYDLSSPIVARDDADDASLYAHVDICVGLNKVDEAWKLASGLYKAHPQEEAAQQAYVKALVASGRRSQAAQTINTLLADANAQMRSFLYYQKSLLDTDSETILSDLRSSLTANPRNRDSLYRLYRIYYNKQDWRRAQYYLKQVVALDRTDDEILTLNAELDRLIGK